MKLRPLYVLSVLTVPTTAWAQNPTTSVPAGPAAGSPPTGAPTVGMPAAAPAPLSPYEARMQRAEAIRTSKIDVVSPENKASVVASSNERMAATARAYEEAAAVAPDDTKRLEALNKAGAQWSLGLYRKDAHSVYSRARDLKGITDVQRKEAALNAASQRYWLAFNAATAAEDAPLVQAEYEKAFALPGLTPLERSSAMNNIADAYTRAKRFLEAAQWHEKAVDANPDYGYSRALLAAENAPASPEITVLMNRLYPRAITAKIFDSRSKTYFSPSALDLRKTKERWAKAFDAKNEALRAKEIYTDLLTGASVTERLALLQKIGTAQMQTKDFRGSLKTWDSIVLEPGLSFTHQRIRANGRANVLKAQGDLKGARAEINNLLGVAGIPNSEKADALFVLAKLWNDEWKQARTTKANPDVLVKAEQETITAMDAVLKAEGVMFTTLVDAVVQRAQVEVDAGRPAAAHPIFESGRKALSTIPGYVRHLWQVESRLYRHEMKFAQAIAAMHLAAYQNTRYGMMPAPDATQQAEAMAMLQEAFGAKKFDDAHAVVTVLDSWGLARKESIFVRAEIDIAAGQHEIARARLAQLDPLAPTAAEKKRKEDLTKKLPPGVAGAPLAVIPPTIQPPVLGAAPTAPVPAPVPAFTYDDEDDW